MVSCGASGVVFLGDVVKTVDRPKQVDTLSGSPVILEGEYTGMMFAYDGMLLFESHLHRGGWLYLYDVETGKRIHAMCRIGQGPNEYMSVHFSGFERYSGETYFWILDAVRNRVKLVNKRCEAIRDIDVSSFRSVNSMGGVGMVHILNDSLLFTYVRSVQISHNKFSAPSYHIFNYKLGETVKIFTLYSDYEVSTNTNLWLPEFYLSSPPGAVKPDRSKIALMRTHLRRLDFIDLVSGKLTSVKMRDSPDLNLISSGGYIHFYFRGIQSDERYIFVVEVLDRRFLGINVFDWEGNFVRILRFYENKDESIFAFDPVRKILYSKDLSERIIAYDLNFLYE